MTSLHDELGGFLRTYEAAWRGGNYDAVRALWDSDEPEPIYVAEESAPLIGWAAIDAYFAGNRKVLANVAIRTWDHQVRAVGEDVAILFYQMHWNAKIVDGSLMGGDVRVSGLVRRTAAGWRFFHYVEAPLAAMVQMRGTLRANCDDDFAQANA
ncbi:MAG: nuclear transport factor 2 family protein [Proteobacteria bacterium]|nr:nuclear transport factor 2 family protein [Pseudomonadota bacterium]MDA1059198.1 nuclear transport factor 2 family protein [Pseudomonadota bacterium]